MLQYILGYIRVLGSLLCLVFWNYSQFPSPASMWACPTRLLSQVPYYFICLCFVPLHSWKPIVKLPFFKGGRSAASDHRPHNGSRHSQSSARTPRPWLLQVFLLLAHHISSTLVSDAAVNSTTTSIVASWKERRQREGVWTDARGRFTTIPPRRLDKPRP